VSRASAAAFAAGYAAVAGLVAAGALTSIDQWAIDHVMPGAYFNGKSTFADAVIPLWGVHWHGVLHIASELVTSPASLTPATVIVAAACVVLRRRAGVALATAYVAGNVVEVLTKATLTRPALYANGAHLTGFDASYPSGHTIRTMLIATAVSLAWPRAGRWTAAWAAGCVALLVVGGQHVPSDIAGGLLLAGALVATTWSSSNAGRTSRRRPSRASRPSARAR
jgi:membrane-associated phospholipid phosphatase